MNMKARCQRLFKAEGGQIEVWGPGSQTRSFLYIDECVEATRRLMDSDFADPVNIGSEEMIAINDFANMAIDISGKDVILYNIDGEEFENKYGHKCPIGVNGRNSDNALYKEKIGWSVSQPLINGMVKKYNWILKQTGDIK
jgi:nucleoside-diphosphate-sugar epimerase